VNGTENENKARARYLKRGIYSNPDNSRKIYLNDLAHKLIPSLGYYILLIIAGITCGLAFLYHSKALLILTLAILPFMGPFFRDFSLSSDWIFFFFGEEFTEVFDWNFLVFSQYFGSGWIRTSTCFDKCSDGRGFIKFRISDSILRRFWIFYRPNGSNDSYGDYLFSCCSDCYCKRFGTSASAQLRNNGWSPSSHWFGRFLHRSTIF